MELYYLGIPGSYSHQVALIYAEKLNLPLQGVITFKEIFKATLDGNLGIIPIENSYAGSVQENLYHMINFKSLILAEHYLAVKHCLASTQTDIGTIQKIYSHPQTLRQCENILHKYHRKSQEFGDNAGAAKYVTEKKDSSTACFTSPYAAQIYKLHVLAENIQDQEENTTRFLLICSENQPFQFTYSEIKKITLVFKTKNIPASLYKCLGAFATRFINLTKIESLPAKNNPFEYLFWLDCEYTVSDKIMEETINELNFFSQEVKILGKY